MCLDLCKIIKPLEAKSLEIKYLMQYVIKMHSNIQYCNVVELFKLNKSNQEYFLKLIRKLNTEW